MNAFSPRELNYVFVCPFDASGVVLKAHSHAPKCTRVYIHVNILRICKREHFSANTCPSLSYDVAVIQWITSCHNNVNIK